MSTESKKQVVKVRIPNGTPIGVYFNLTMSRVTGAEFVLDLCYHPPGAPEAQVRCQVVTNPQHVKVLIETLASQLAGYEKVHGNVVAPATPDIEKLH